MKQVLLGKKINISDVPTPGLGAKEVLVEVAYSFISTGTEMAGVSAAKGSLISKITEHPQRIATVLEMIRVNGIKKTLTRVKSKLETRGPLGYSCAGRVIAVGSGIRDITVGDEVACGGQGSASHAEVVAVPQNLVAKLPEGCDLRSASGTIVGCIALQGVRRVSPQLGETIAVVGLGLLGQISLQLLKANGCKVIGLDPNPARVEECKAAGFDNCFALTGDQATNEVLIRTGQNGADATVITAATSVEGICQNAMEMTRRKGKVVVVGAVPLQFDRDPFYRKEIDFLISCSYGAGRYDPSYEADGIDYPYGYVRWTENRNMQAIMNLIADGSLDYNKLISAEYPNTEADKAFAALSAEGGTRPLGVVLKYDLAEETKEEKLSPIVRMANPKPLEGKISVGVIGAGQFCRHMHIPHLATLGDRFRITHVCDKVGAVAQDIARQHGAAVACTDPEELFKDPNLQVVLITTRHNTHASLAKAAIKAGKHVLVEKPMAMNEEEMTDLLDTIQASDKYFMVGFNRRFSPHVQRLRELLANRISPLVANYRVMADPSPKNSWVYTPAGGGRVIGEGCHMLDLLNYIVGDDVDIEELDVVAPPVSEDLPAGDAFSVTIKYADGSICNLTYTTLGKKSKENGKERIEAMWDNKTFVVDDFVGAHGSGCSAGSAANKKGKGHYEELVALADYLEGKASEPLSLNASVRATRISFEVDAVCRGVQES